jgi:aminoglycoside phosphotransferase (APT) family kinase protein
MADRTENPMAEMLPRVRTYLANRDWRDVPVMAGRNFRVEPLAQGEYNLNYLLIDPPVRLVFRVNLGSQIEREDQILYEYRALELLKESGATPVPYFVDDRGHVEISGRAVERKIPPGPPLEKGGEEAEMDRGILIMEYLPGGPLDYRREREDAAKLFARIHRVRVPEERNHLIREEAPLSIIFEECERLLSVYFESDLADSNIRAYLKDVRAWMNEARGGEKYFQADPWPCVVNTEVNSGNFIVNRSAGTVHLVDWEMPRYGDPTADLCHFCSPLTTMWKTDYRMSEDERRDFLRVYAEAVGDAHLRDTLDERFALRNPFVLLRGISWSVMGWVAYQTDFAGVRNPDTWETLKRYMDYRFIRSIFDSILARSP